MGKKEKTGVDKDSWFLCLSIGWMVVPYSKGVRLKERQGLKCGNGKNKTPERIGLGSSSTLFTRQCYVASTKSGWTHLKITCSLQSLSAICWLTLFNFIDSDLGVYSTRQASHLEELEFPLSFFGSKFFCASPSCHLWMVSDTYRGWNCLHGPYSNLFTGQWASSHGLLKDVCL